MTRSLPKLIRADSDRAIVECVERLTSGEIPGFAIPASKSFDTDIQDGAIHRRQTLAVTERIAAATGFIETGYFTGSNTGGDQRGHIDFEFEYYQEPVYPAGRIFGVHTSNAPADVTLGVVQPAAIMRFREPGEIGPAFASIFNNVQNAQAGKDYDREVVGPVHAGHILPGVTTVFTSRDTIDFRPTFHDFETSTSGQRRFHVGQLVDRPGNADAIYNLVKGMQP